LSEGQISFGDVIRAETLPHRPAGLRGPERELRKKVN
jgi:hypothetical protein